ncbi:CAMK/PKD protein kinase, partial [Sphaeroforma arctica JP610]
VIEWRKLLDFEMSRPENLKAEMSLLKALRHPGIVSLEHIYSTPETLFLVMERAFGGDFLDRILNSPQSHLSERHTKFYLWQTLISLVYLHNNKVAHRDLKPENVLLSTSDEFTQSKLCDFGFARIVGEDSFMKSLVGTKAYVAPEVLAVDSTGGYKLKIDLWSVGVIAYVSLSGTFPFKEDEAISPRALQPNILFPAKHWGHVSNAAKLWILRAFEFNPEKRFSAVEALMDPWLQDKILKGDLKNLESRLGGAPIMQMKEFLRV